MAEQTHEIKFRTRSETADVEAMRKRLGEVKKELKEIQSIGAQRWNMDFRGTGTKASWDIAPGEHIRQRGSYLDEVTRRLHESTNIQKRLGTFQPVRPGAEPPPLPDMGMGAGGADGMDGMIRQASQLANATGNTRVGFGLSRMATGIKSVGVAAVATAAGVAALAGGTAALIARMAAGAREASEMAKSLNELDADERGKMVEKFGGLAAVLDANHASLMKYADALETAEARGGSFWAAAGTGMLPVLNETRAALNDLDTTAAGLAFGDTISGFFTGIMGTAKALGGVLGELGDVITNIPLPPKWMLHALPGVGGAAALAEMAHAAGAEGREAEEASAREELAEKRRGEFAKTDAELAEERELAAMSPIDRHKALEEKLLEQSDIMNKDLAGPEFPAAARKYREYERQIAAVKREIEAEGRKAEEEEIAEGERRAEATDAAERSAMLDEAKARGDDGEVRRLEWLADYEADIERGVSEDVARRRANAKDAVRYAEEPESGRDEGVGVSDLARRGGDMAESMAAALAGIDMRGEEQIARDQLSELKQLRVEVGRLAAREPEEVTVLATMA